MAGALRRRRGEAEQARDLALIGAWFAGQLANWDWSKNRLTVGEWIARMTRPPVKPSQAELIAKFEALVARTRAPRTEQ